MKSTILVAVAALALPSIATACARESGPAAVVVAAPTADAPVSLAPPMAAWPTMLVHKTASCGCCGLWVEHMREAGFTVEVRDHEDLGPVKQRLGVPYGKGSCHTAEVGGYMIEGHVPAVDVKRLLTDKPRVRGLVLPGMPLGSPGMEVADGTVQPYVVEAVNADGGTVPYAAHGPAAK